MQIVGDRTAAYTIRNKHWADLVEKLEYRTDRPPSRFFERFRFLASIVYHVGMYNDVFVAMFPCKRGTYSRVAWSDTSVSMLRSAERAGGRFTVTGIANVVQAGGPVVLVANHMSTLETFTLQTFLLPLTDICYVIKEQLLHYPVFKHIMRGVEPIAVGRKNPRDDLKTVLEKGTAVLASGRSVVIFPQATRDAVFDPSQFNSLGIKLAARAGVPVVPVALKTDFLSNGTWARWAKDFGPIDPRKRIFIEFGPPMRIAGGGKEQHEAVVSFIRERLLRWGATVREDVHKH